MWVEENITTITAASSKQQWRQLTPSWYIEERECGIRPITMGHILHSIFHVYVLRYVVWLRIRMHNLYCLCLIFFRNFCPAWLCIHQNEHTRSFTQSVRRFGLVRWFSSCKITAKKGKMKTSLEIEGVQIPMYNSHRFEPCRYVFSSHIVKATKLHAYYYTHHTILYSC